MFGLFCFIMFFFVSFFDNKLLVCLIRLEFSVHEFKILLVSELVHVGRKVSIVAATNRADQKQENLQVATVGYIRLYRRELIKLKRITDVLDYSFASNFFVHERTTAYHDRLIFLRLKSVAIIMWMFRFSSPLSDTSLHRCLHPLENILRIGEKTKVQRKTIKENILRDAVFFN